MFWLRTRLELQETVLSQKSPKFWVKLTLFAESSARWSPAVTVNYASVSKNIIKNCKPWKDLLTAHSVFTQSKNLVRGGREIHTSPFLG
jgi:hypothetical protein